MKDKEYENKRHKIVLERISNACNIKELPNVSISNLAKYLADNVYFDDKHLDAKTFRPLIDKLFDNDNLTDFELKNCFIKILKSNYPNHSDEEYVEKFNSVFATGRIKNMLDELMIKNDRAKCIRGELNFEKHYKIMEAINHATTIKELDSITRFDLDEILDAATKNEFVDNIPKSILENYIQAVYSNDIEKINDEIRMICNYFENKVNNEYDFNLMLDEITSNTFAEAKNISYAIDEESLYNDRVKSIYLNEHLAVLESINAATSLSKLPKNLNDRKICDYLVLNSQVKNKKFKSEDFKELVEILLNGEKIDSDIIKDCLRKIIKDGNYADTRRQRDNLIDRLISNYTSLNRLDYFIEEVNLCRQREQEFTTEKVIDVELYIIPTPNSPEKGGKHYTLFKNEVSNLDLTAIAPSYSSLDELEEKVQKIYPSFKKVGGIILKSNERINLSSSGNIKFYRDEVGKQLISTERKEKIKKLLEAQQELEDALAQDKAQYEEKVKITSGQLKEIKKEIQKLASLDETKEVEKKKNFKNES